MLALNGVVYFLGRVACTTQKVARRGIEHKQVLFCVWVHVFLDKLQGSHSAFVTFVFRICKQEFYTVARVHFYALFD